MRAWIAVLGIGCVMASSAIAASDADAETVSDRQSTTLLRNTADGWSVGDRVRVTLRGIQGGTAGRFADLRNDSLFLSVADSPRPLMVRASQIGMIEEVGGHKRHFVTGAIVGMIAGTAIGAIIAENDRDPNAFVDLSALAIPIGAVGGFVGGGIIGYSITTDRWVVTATFD